MRKEDEKGEKEKHHAFKKPGISTKNRFLLLAEKGKAARDRSVSAKRFRTDSECTEASEFADEPRGEGCSRPGEIGCRENSGTGSAESGTRRDG